MSPQKGSKKSYAEIIALRQKKALRFGANEGIVNSLVVFSTWKALGGYL
jgi:hypothetical protein